MPKRAKVFRLRASCLMKEALPVFFHPEAIADLLKSRGKASVAHGLGVAIRSPNTMFFDVPRTQKFVQ
jgi:hypothetical protein